MASWVMMLMLMMSQIGQGIWVCADGEEGEEAKKALVRKSSSHFRW